MPMSLEQFVQQNKGFKFKLTEQQIAVLEAWDKTRRGIPTIARLARQSGARQCIKVWEEWCDYLGIECQGVDIEASEPVEFKTKRDDMCPECGVRSRVDGLCPKCGVSVYAMRPLSPEHEPKRHAHIARTMDIDWDKVHRVSSATELELLKQTAPEEYRKVQRDMLLYGTGWVRNGKHVPMKEVMVDRGITMPDKIVTSKGIKAQLDVSQAAKIDFGGALTKEALDKAIQDGFAAYPRSRGITEQIMANGPVDSDFDMKAIKSACVKAPPPSPGEHSCRLCRQPIQLAGFFQAGSDRVCSPCGLLVTVRARADEIRRLKDEVEYKVRRIYPSLTEIARSRPSTRLPKSISDYKRLYDNHIRGGPLPGEHGRP